MKVLLSQKRKDVKQFCQKRVSSEGTLVVFEKPDHMKRLMYKRDIEKMMLRVEEDTFGPLGPGGRYLGR
ncbi:MAG: hypothetical protein AABX99_02380 [Nanoarchaeota archaeon]